METLPVQKGNLLLRPVERVAGHRMPDIGHMHPNLMGAPGLQPEAKVAEPLVPLQHRKMGNRRFGVLVGHGHLLAFDRMPADGGVHPAAVLFYISVHDRLITAVEGVFLNLFCEAGVRTITFGHNQQAAGVLINAVDNARPQHAVDAREAVAAMRQQRVDQRAVPVARRRMHNHPLRLVHHHKIIVLIHDVERDILRLDIQRLRLRQGEKKMAARSDFERFYGGSAVYLQAAGRNHCGGRRPADSGNPADQQVGANRRLLRTDKFHALHLLNSRLPLTLKG